MSPGRGPVRRAGRALSPSDVADVLGRARPVPTACGTPAAPASDLSGVAPDGTARHFVVTGPSAPPWTLLLFLSTSCTGCGELWRLVASGVRPFSDETRSHTALDDVSVLGVTRGPGREDARHARELAGQRGNVVMSDEAWRGYRVHGPPFFVLVSRLGHEVVGEGVAWGAGNVVGHLRRAVRRGV